VKDHHGSRVLVLQHHPSERPGSLGALLEAAGLDLVTVELDAGDTIPSLDDFAAMLVMGGPMDVWEEAEYRWLDPEKAAIRDWVTVRRRPFLGVCLGNQLLADALGGVVAPMRTPEVGLHPVHRTAEAEGDPLFAGLPPEFEAVHWHLAEVRRLPAGATLLSTNGTSAVQAFRAGSQAWGIQFHIEAEPDTVSRWIRARSYAEALEETYPGGVDGFLTATAAASQTLQQIAGEVASQFLALI
jgi:GMP synthase-like glutamine amidotransferase